jgi:hypothetical protein
MRAFRHEEPDRTPVFEYVLQSKAVWKALLGRLPVLSDWETAVRERGWEPAVRQLAADYLDLARALGHDLIYATPNPAAPGTRAPPKPSKTGTIRHAQPPIDDPVEKVAARTRNGEARYAGINDDTLLIYHLIKEALSERGQDLPILAPAYEHGVWTDVDLMQTLLLAPEVAADHFAFATRRAEDRIDSYVSLGIELIGIGGDFAGNQPLISPAAYRTFIVPEMKKLSDRIRGAGRWSVNASDGNLWGVLDDFLVASGTDGYLEIDSHAGMDLPRLKAAYGPRTTFLGNLDCGTLLSFGTPEAICEAVRDCLDAGQGGGGHILTASNAITDSVPVTNYMALVNAYREYFGLPLIS